MYEKVVKDEPDTLRFVPDHLKTPGACEKAVEKNPWLLEYVPDNLETQGMCEGTVKKCSGILGLVLDWFVTQGQVKVWHDHNYYCNNDKLIEWYEDLQKRKAQKEKKKEEHLPLAWYPSRWCDWCVPENEKKETETNCGHKNGLFCVW